MSRITPETPEQNLTLERLKSLYELIGRMNSVYDQRELLEYVIDRALSLTGGRRGLLLLNGEANAPLPQIAVVRGQDLDSQRQEEIRQFVSTTVIGEVLDQGEPRLIIDLQADQRYEGLSKSATGQFKKIRSVLAVPLTIEAELIGLIYIDHPRRAVFEQSDLDFLSAFATQAALAINRARQHQRQVAELTLLNELSRSVAQVLDLDEVLTRIVRQVCRMVNVETSSVLLLDEDSGELIFATSVSNGQRAGLATRLKKDQGIAGWVATHGEPVCISDVAADPRWYGEVQADFTTRSILCVPLQLEGRILGVLQALNKKSPHGFDSGDLALMSAFAASATISIENARLFREARQAHQLRALNTIALELSSTLDLNTILQTGLAQSLEVLRESAGAICLVGDTPLQVSQGLAADPALAGRQLAALDRLSRQAAGRSADEVLVISPAQAAAWPESGELFNAGLAGLALTPIKIGSTIGGALVVLSTGPRVYTEEDISLLTGITRIMGLAIQNASHYNQVRAQAVHLAYLNEVGGVLTSSLDLGHVLRVIIAGVNSLLETERTSIFLIDPETNELVLRYGTEGDLDIRLPAPWQGIAGWVAKHDQPALVNDTTSDIRHLRQIAIDTGYEAHSILCVPLKINDEVIGVVEVLNKTGGRQFNHDDEAVLSGLTRWAAIAIHNARLFDERFRAYQHLAAEQKRRITAETRSAMASVILGMAHTMNNIVGAIRVWALTLENEPTGAAGAAAAKRLARQIRENAEEAIDLVRNMRGPLEQAILAPTDVHRCLAAAISSCWWPDNVHLRQEYDPAIPLVRANEQRLETAFHNLLSNAIQALSLPGGEIFLQTSRTGQGEVQVTIADNGPGIPLELQDRVFDPGVTSKEGGLGIGLWLVESFIHQFNGTIDFTSSAEAGTTFVITLVPLPLAASAGETGIGENSYDSAI